MAPNNNHHPPPTAKTSILLPTYNEKDNIVELVQAIHGHLGPDGFNYEVVIVDDNSPDGTADVVRAALGEDVRVKLHVRTAERGLATALRYGAEVCDGQVLVFMAPFMTFIFSPPEYERFARLLEKRRSIDLLIDAIVERENEWTS